MIPSHFLSSKEKKHHVLSRLSSHPIPSSLPSPVSERKRQEAVPSPFTTYSFSRSPLSAAVLPTSHHITSTQQATEIDIPRKEHTLSLSLSFFCGLYCSSPPTVPRCAGMCWDVMGSIHGRIGGGEIDQSSTRILFLPELKTVKGRSHTYTKRVAEILGEKNVRLSTPIVSMKKIGWGVYDDGTEQRKQYELFTSRSDNQSAVSVGVYDELIFACHTDTAASILQHNIMDTIDTTSSKVDNPTCSSHRIIDPSLIATLSQIEYANNVVYLHSDPKLMPQRKRAWASWNCLGNSQQIHTALGVGGKIGSSSSSSNNSTGRSETGAFEGAESGFGNTAATSKSTSSSYSSSSNRSDMENNDTTTPDDDTLLEGKEGRMKAVYLTYWLNKLQNLETTTSSDSKEEETNIFVSLNPHNTPDPTVTYQRTHFSHLQFTPTTLEARTTLQAKYQGTQGLWFCGAYLGYGFHEDGCRSGFEVATTLSGISLPWVPRTTVATKLKSEPKTTKKRRSIMKKHNDHCCSSPTTTTTNTM